MRLRTQQKLAVLASPRIPMAKWWLACSTAAVIQSEKRAARTAGNDVVAATALIVDEAFSGHRHAQGAEGIRAC
jgi:hypothetical protein